MERPDGVFPKIGMEHPPLFFPLGAIRSERGVGADAEIRFKGVSIPVVVDTIRNKGLRFMHQRELITLRVTEAALGEQLIRCAITIEEEDLLRHNGDEHNTTYQNYSVFETLQ